MKEIINNIKDNALFSGISGEELEELLKHLNYYIERYPKKLIFYWLIKILFNKDIKMLIIIIILLI